MGSVLEAERLMEHAQGVPISALRRASTGVHMVRISQDMLCRNRLTHTHAWSRKTTSCVEPITLGSVGLADR